jgi:hypothetical protein
MSKTLRVRLATLQHACNVATLQVRRLPGCCNTTPGKKPLRVFSRRVARHGVRVASLKNRNTQKIALTCGRVSERAFFANSQKVRT